MILSKFASAMLTVVILVFTASSATAVGVTVAPGSQPEPKTLSLPYVFYNDSFGAALGWVYAKVGAPQKQSSFVATVMAGSKGSALGALIGRDFRVPKFERLFLDPIISIGYFDENDYFIDGNPDYPSERSGSNDSNEDDFVEGSGWDNYFRLTFKYLLPIGHGRDQVISTYEIDNGLLVSAGSGGTSLNPLKSGKTFVQLRPFYRSQDIDSDTVDDAVRTNGVDFSIYWDNRDFFANPSRGNSLMLKVSRDFGWMDSSDSWTNLQLEWDQYFSLGSSKRFRQRVIAVDLWTAYSTTWEVKSDGTIENRPPAYAGSTLGGLWKLRGYPTQRFSDKAAIYYAAELRLIPHWNPFDRWPWLQKHLGIEWLQLVPFGEIGRVAPSWNLSDLHSDMKWSAGLGLRFWAKGIVARIDTAASDEGARVQMMVSQPFQF